MNFTFSSGAATHTAWRMEDYGGKPGQWWRCDALDAYVGLPYDATLEDATAAFESLAAPQENITQFAI